MEGEHINEVVDSPVDDNQDVVKQAEEAIRTASAGRPYKKDKGSVNYPLNIVATACKIDATKNKSVVPDY
ncbi:MAG: hypothetical protein V3V78_03470 [Candidatus Woesearchaeota archaeon]